MGSWIGDHRATGRARGRSSYDDVVCHPVGCVRSLGATRASPSCPGGPIRAQGGPQAHAAQGHRDAHKGPAQKGSWGPTRARPTMGPGAPTRAQLALKGPAHKGPAHKGPGVPTRAHGGPQGPGPQGPRGAHKGPALKSPAHMGPGGPTRARARAPKGPGGHPSPPWGWLICLHHLLIYRSVLCFLGTTAETNSYTILFYILYYIKIQQIILSCNGH